MNGNATHHATPTVEEKVAADQRQAEARQLVLAFVAAHFPKGTRVVNPTAWDALALLVAHVQQLEEKVQALEARLDGAPDGQRRIIVPGQG